MDIQFKKGILDVCVLKCLNEEDSYGYKLVTEITKVLEISESTLYPILRRLENLEYLTIYKEEHNGRLRKYYKITTSGKKHYQRLLKEVEIMKKVLDFITKGENNEKK